MARSLFCNQEMMVRFLQAALEKEMDIIKFDGHEIKVLSTNEAIRKRPGMYVAYKKNPEEKIAIKAIYVGNDLKDPHSLTNLIIEAMCLSRAFAATGQATEISVKINGNSVLISDNGPGISMEKKHGDLSTIEILLTQLHACKNIKHDDIEDFCEKGIVVVNALSESFEVLNVVDDMSYVIHYKKGELEKAPHIIGVANHKGLAFKFTFDSEIFSDLKIDKNDVIVEIEKIKPTTPAKITVEFDN